ncbi:MAG: M12 family metallopeptidase [Acidobacteria bacterium]|nr:M12 family metallopeptidase [Acidobacteriota bacterium]MBI3657791.1 M12 family metallopeptidase [Acidobacteriota bacterium]
MVAAVFTLSLLIYPVDAEENPAADQRQPGIYRLESRATPQTRTQTDRAGAALTHAEGYPLRTGVYRGRQVTFVEVDRQAVYEGDIILGAAHELEAAVDRSFAQGIGVTYSSALWPPVGGAYQVPFIVTGAPGSVAAAIASFNDTFTGFIQFVPRATETDYVDINLNAGNPSGVCFSSVGRVGGRQEISGSANCAADTLLHEMGHTLGLWHEQSRADRDTYIDVQFRNIIKGSQSNFDQLLDNAQSLGLYDYRSLMHYEAYGFTRNGEPTLESIPPGIPLSNRVGYTEGDIDGLQRLYAAAPTAVTIASNPPGLQVMVDGVAITTPQTFDFVLNSTHELGVPNGSQPLAGITYTYGRWNDDVAANHTITISPGNGLPASPVTSPAVTVYTAHFIELVPFTQTVTPQGSGSITASPLPASYPPAPGLFYVARQAVTLQATANPGYNFYQWFGLSGPGSSNPKVIRTPGNISAAFTSSPITTITTNPAGRWIWVDGVFYFGPQNFALPYNPAWTPGSSHNVNIMISPQLPYSINSRYAFAVWSDGGAPSHTITVPSGNFTLTANFTPQYALVQFVTPGCAGFMAVSQLSPDGYYSDGTRLTFAQTPNNGWIFAGWQGDLSGTASPQSLSVRDEPLVQALYNTTTAPLTVTNLRPPMTIAGGDGMTLTINGTGFTRDSLVFVNGIFRTSTFMSPTELSVEISADDIATAGAFQVGVSNFPTGSPCSAFAARPFFVQDPAAAAP